MKQQLPILVAIALLTLALSFSVHAQDSDLQTSDFALDIQQGEKGTANDQDAQNNQQEVAQNEDAQAAADDGDPSTGLVQAALDEAVQPEEAQESAKLVENPQATTSENDNEEVLKDQSIQTPQEKPNEDVNTLDDNKAPSSDPDTQPQATQNQEQSMENIQQLPSSSENSSDNQPTDQGESQ